MDQLPQPPSDPEQHQEKEPLNRLGIDPNSFSDAGFAAETTRKLMGLGDIPIEVLPNPVDTRLFRPYPDIPVRDGLIVFTGGLREKKGIRQLTQAMSQVIDQIPSACLWIHGADRKDHAEDIHL